MTESPASALSDPNEPYALEKLALFSQLSPEALAALRERISIVWLPSGQDLFAEGDPPDALYVLISGALGVLRPDASGGWKLIGEVAAGETVGEMALLSGSTRNATVRALRDCEVLCFKRCDFEELMTTQASAMLQLARVAFQRLEQSNLRSSARRARRTFAILPAAPGVSGADFAFELKQSLQRFGSVLWLREEDMTGKSSADFHQMEQQHSFLLYQANATEGTWFDLCHRQADEVVWLASGDSLPASNRPILSLDDGLKRQRLVLHHQRDIAPGLAASWQRLLPSAPLHHVRWLADYDRLARFLAGYATGLVLGGGGARGFAHLGVIRALREAGLEIDTVAGTSIGAIVAAGVAMQWSDEELYFRYHRSFVQSNPLTDYTLPLVALVAGRKASARLRDEYGAFAIEDLPLPFFCVSSNLSRGELVEHRCGPVWHALRASIAIPGVLPPVFKNGQVLVDGGVINNLPVDVMRRDLVGRLIGVDIAGDYAISAKVEEADLPPLYRMTWDWFRGVRPRPSILQILLRSGMVNSASKAEQNRHQSDLLIRPPVEQIELLDWSAFDRVIDIGYRHTVKLLQQGVLLEKP